MNRNYKHLWALLNGLPGDKTEHKDRLVREYTKGRTTSLNDLTDEELKDFMGFAGRKVIALRMLETKPQRQAKCRNILGLTEDQYNMNMFEWSYQYMEHTLCAKPEIISIYHASDGYWLWWRNQFDIADARFLAVYKRQGMVSLSRKELMVIYKDYHINISAIPTEIINRFKNTLKHK